MKYIIASFLSKNKLFKKIYQKIYRKLSFQNNKIVLIKTNGEKIYNPKIKGLRVLFEGNNNYIEINAPIKIKDRFILNFYGDNNRFIIGKNSSIRDLSCNQRSNTEIKIGSNFSSFYSKLNLFRSKNTKITIGNDCMLSYNIEIRCSDSHKIYDKDTKEILNPDKDCTIGNHVWLAQGVHILKGTIIPDNCVVGLGSIVNKKFTEKNCIIAGTPAKVVKHNINWDMEAPFNIN